MERYICISKNRTNKKIVSYELKTVGGTAKTINSDELKELMQTDAVSVINLQLTSDNRIVDKNVSAERIMKFLNKGKDFDRKYRANKKLRLTAPMIRNIVGEFKREHKDVYSRNEMSFMIKSNTDIDRMDVNTSKAKSFDRDRIYYGYKKSTNTIYIASEYSLCFSGDITGLFSEMKFKTLSLYNVDFSEVTSMALMFSKSRIDNININSFDTRNVQDMHYMFYDARIRMDSANILVSKLNTSKVVNMLGMFEEFGFSDTGVRHTSGRKTKLMVGNIDTSSVKYATNMYKNIKVDCVTGFNGRKEK